MSIADLAARLEQAWLPKEHRRSAIFEALIREAEPDVTADAAAEGLPLTADQVTAILNHAPTPEPAWAAHRVQVLNRMRNHIYKPLHDGVTRSLTLHLPSGDVDHPGADVADILNFYGRALTAGAVPAIARYLTVSNLVAAGYPFLRLPWWKPELAPALAAARDGQPEWYLELVVGTAGR